MRLSVAGRIFDGITTARWASQAVYYLDVGFCMQAAKTIVVFAVVSEKMP